MISKELLNRNRVLTMSNNRRCNLLIVNVGRESTIMMGIATSNNTKDILVVKEIFNKKNKELVDIAYWICKEFSIDIVLTDVNGMGLGFYDEFNNNIPNSNISIRKIKGQIIAENSIELINEIQKNIENGSLRFLQSPECAQVGYRVSFLGLSEVMNSHKETDMLIDEINNIKIEMNANNNKLRYIRENDEVGKSRYECLLMNYSYPLYCEKLEKTENSKDFDTAQRMALYEGIHSVFYKYMFKSIEYKNLNIIFFVKSINKILQFQNIAKEKEFTELFREYIKELKINKENLYIQLTNGSQIKFVGASDNARNYRCHYAIVDKEISWNILNEVIMPISILFDMDKRNGKLVTGDIYNIEYLDI